MTAGTYQFWAILFIFLFKSLLKSIHFEIIILDLIIFDTNRFFMIFYIQTYVPYYTFFFNLVFLLPTIRWHYLKKNPKQLLIFPNFQNIMCWILRSLGRKIQENSFVKISKYLPITRDCIFVFAWKSFSYNSTHEVCWAFLKQKQG